jgi:hypothetical protein
VNSWKIIPHSNVTKRVIFFYILRVTLKMGEREIMFVEEEEENSSVPTVVLCYSGFLLLFFG